MAKREKRRRSAKMTRKYQSRVAKERRQIRNIRIGAGIVVAIIVLLALAGLFKTQVADPAATRRAKEELKTLPAATVNDTVISIADWQARVRFGRLLRINQVAQINQQLGLFDPGTEFGQQLISQGQAQMQEIRSQLESGDAIATEILDQMVNEQIIRQEAIRRGIIITPEELQQYIEVDLFAYPYPPTPEPYPTLPAPTLPPTATVTPEPTVTPTAPPTPRSLEDFETDYTQYTSQIEEITEMSEALWRSMIEGDLYYQKLLEAFGAEVETNVLHVKGRYIAAETQETAEALLERLDAGESYEALEEEVKADESEELSVSASSFDWLPLYAMQERFGGAFATAAIGTSAGDTVQEIIPALDGRFYLVYVEGNEIRKLADYRAEQQRNDAFQGWLDAQKLADGIEYGNWLGYIPLEPTLP